MSDSRSINPLEPISLPVEALRAYRQVLTVHFFAALALILVLAYALLSLEALKQSGGSLSGSIRIGPVVVLSGALGALVSALQRLYRLEGLPAALVKPLPGLADWHLWLYSLIPPILGMVGAIFFYLLILSGVVEGPLFQTFHCDLQGQSCNGSLSGLLSYSPKEATDYAKAIVWAFVSGFSERLVPDALARMESSKGGGKTNGS